MWVLGEAGLVRGKRCRDGNECEAYFILFLFGLFFAVCHPYIICTFCRMFFRDLFVPREGFLMMM